MSLIGLLICGVLFIAVTLVGSAQSFFVTKLGQAVRAAADCLGAKGRFTLCSPTHAAASRVSATRLLPEDFGRSLWGQGWEVQ